ncbi:MAG: hypothetical protein HY774_00855 [Acidobacteria bacterium]|nr:hypothetical protein [Acidobacteriota bacterium]
MLAKQLVNSLLVMFSVYFSLGFPLVLIDKELIKVEQKREKKLIRISFIIEPNREKYQIDEFGYSSNKLEDVIFFLQSQNKKKIGYKFEFYSDHKLPTELIIEFKQEFKKRGIKLEHFWVPVGWISSKQKYPGWIDVGSNYKKNEKKIKY